MTLLFVFGPPAVGKMAVAAWAIAGVSDFRLFHNHATIEPLLDVFDYGTPAFLPAQRPRCATGSSRRPPPPT